MAAGDVEVNITTNSSRRCAVFDGINDDLTITTSPFYTESATSMSISVWAYVNSNDFDGTAMYIMDTGSGNPAGNGGFYILLDDRGGAFSPLNGLQVLMKSTTSYEGMKSNDDIFTVPGWYHILVEHDNGTGKIYVNNVDVTNTYNDGSGNFSPRNAALAIGANNSGTGRNNSAIGEIAFYNRKLTSAEKTLLMNNRTLQTSPTHLYTFKDDYTDSVGSEDLTNSGSYLSILDDGVARAVWADRTTSGDNYMAVGLPGGQVVSVVVEET